MATNTTGPAMFADLTTDELTIAIAKLSCGATTAVRVTNGAHDFHIETHAVLRDMHVAWNDRFAAEHPGAAQ